MTSTPNERPHQVAEPPENTMTPTTFVVRHSFGVLHPCSVCGAPTRTMRIIGNPQKELHQHDSSKITLLCDDCLNKENGHA